MSSWTVLKRGGRRIFFSFYEIALIVLFDSYLTNICSYSYCYMRLYVRCSMVLVILLIMSHSLLWRYFADGRCLFKQPQSVIYHWNQYDEEISKKCRSVRLSVRSFVTLTKKAYSSFIIESRKIIRISGERAYHPLQENEAIFSKKYLSTILERIFEKFCTWIKCLLLLHYKQ